MDNQYQLVKDLRNRIEELEAAATKAIRSWDGTCIHANNRKYRLIEAERFDALRALLHGKGTGDK